MLGLDRPGITPVTEFTLGAVAPWNQSSWAGRLAASLDGNLAVAAAALAAGQIGLQKVAFNLLWLFIGAVSSYDAYLTMKFDDSIAAMELNPLGVWLIELDGGDPSLFIGVKFLGTIVVLGLLNLIHRCHHRMGWTLIGMLAAFQGWLLTFLTAG